MGMDSMNQSANQPEPSLREQIANVMRNKSHYGVAETAVLSPIMQLFQADKEAAVEEAYNKGWIDCQRSKAEHRRLHKEQL